jgi:hypothetical protein
MGCVSKFRKIIFLSKRRKVKGEEQLHKEDFHTVNSSVITVVK